MIIPWTTIAIVLDLDGVEAVVFETYVDGRCSCIEAVFHQFLSSRV